MGKLRMMTWKTSRAHRLAHHAASLAPSQVSVLLTIKQSADVIMRFPARPGQAGLGSCSTLTYLHVATVLFLQTERGLSFRLV